MTPTQIKLARHALGLPNNRRKSYRNHFVCGEGHSDYDNWQEMVAGELAWHRPGSALSGGEDVFWLTPKGAVMALKKGERLDLDDFPDQSAVALLRAAHESSAHHRREDAK